jgi:hypothetical protein
VCKEGATFHITKYPRKIANTNDKNKFKKSSSVPIATPTKIPAKMTILSAHPTHLPVSPSDFYSVACNLITDYYGLASYYAPISL